MEGDGDQPPAEEEQKVEGEGEEKEEGEDDDIDRDPNASVGGEGGEQINILDMDPNQLKSPSQGEGSKVGEDGEDGTAQEGLLDPINEEPG